MEPNQSMVNTDLILRERMALERTKMANYRTFLAFLRTSLYFPVAGVSMHQALSLSYGKYLQLAGIIIGAIVLIADIVFNVITARRMKAFEASIGTHFQIGED